MKHPHQTHICAITPADLDAVKALLEIIIGNTVSASHRIEVFARLAGYRTYAALKADLQDRLDIFGNPLPTPIYASPRKNDPFLTQLPIEVRRKLAKLEHVGLLKVVAVALKISNDPVFGNIGIEPHTLDSIFQIAMKEKKHQVSHDDFTLELPAGRLILVASPSNLTDLKTKGSGSVDDTPETSDLNNRWHLSPTYLPPNTRFFDSPRPEDLVSMEPGSIEGLASLVQDGTLVFFSQEDIDDFSTFVTSQTGRFVNPQTMVSVKAAALEIEYEDDGGFFGVGYYGTARNDVPPGEDALAALSGDFAVQWLSEIANVVHGCNFEYKRLSIGVAA